MKKQILNMIRTVAGIIPKKKNLWLFGAWEGQLYADNAKYMFEYVNMIAKGKIKAVWLTKNKKVLKKVREAGYDSCYKWSMRGIWLAFRAGVAFETEGDGDVSSFMKHTMVVQLWHGMGYKAMKWVDDKGNKLFSDEQCDKHRCSKWMSPSKMYNGILHDLIGIPEENFFLTGYPRNDMMVVKPQNKYFEDMKVRYPGCKFIIYMPTHRNFGKEQNPYASIEQLKKINALLAEQSVVMVYKPHFHEMRHISESEMFSNIVLARDAEIYGDVYSYLHYFDLLISDYSSVITDFACSGYPAVFFPYDLEKYNQDECGLLSCFFEKKLGPFGYTWEEVLSHVFRLLQDDTWKEERIRVLKEYHSFTDGKNRERVYKTVCKLIEQGE